MSDELSEIRTNLAVAAERISQISNLYAADKLECHREMKDWWKWRSEVNEDRTKMKTTVRILGILWVAGIGVLGVMQAMFPEGLQ